MEMMERGCGGDGDRVGGGGSGDVDGGIICGGDGGGVFVYPMIKRE